MKMYVKYRDEFCATVNAKNIDEAIKKFTNDKKTIFKCCNELHYDYFEVESSKGKMLKQEGSW